MECWSCDEDSADGDVDGAPINFDDVAQRDAEFTGGPADAETDSPWQSRARSRRHDGTLGLHACARAALRLQIGGGQTRLVHARRARGDG